jgi:predicted dehydrogenase
MKRCGIVGFGRIGSGIGRDYEVLPRIYFPYSLAEAIDVSREGGLSCVSDLSTVALNQAPVGVKKFNSYVEMLNIVPLDFLAVTTRAPDRWAIFELGVKKGIKLFHLEKPLCSSFIELDNIMVACSKEEVNFTYGALRRYLQPYRLVKSLIDSAEFGKMNTITVNYGSGNLFWTHPHSIDLILYYVGEHRNFRVEEVVGEVINSTVVGERVELITDPLIKSVVLSFDDNVIGEITNTPGQSIFVKCDNHEFRINDDGKEVVLIDRFGNESVIWSEAELESIEGFKLVLDELFTSNTTRENHRVRTGMLDAFEGQEILFKICLNLFLKQNPESFSLDQDKYYFQAMNSEGLFA